jgi:hypothetical protein
VAIVAPLMTNFDQNSIKNNLISNDGSTTENDNPGTPSLRDTNINLENLINPDVGYADRIDEIGAYAARIGAATNPHYNPPKLSHMTYLSPETKTLTFMNNGLPTIYNSPELSATVNLPTKDIKIIDFGSDTGIPMLTTSSPNGGNYDPADVQNNINDTLPIPYHIDRRMPSRSTVNSVTTVNIYDGDSTSTNSPMEEIGFYSFSG